MLTQKRKLQLSNGHYLEFDQLARIIHTIAHADTSQKITKSFLEEETGLPFRQVENRVIIGRSMGVFAEKSLRLTPFGQLVAEHDIFFESKGTLEYIHYLASADYSNLIWHDAFNILLTNSAPLDYQGWLRYFRVTLAGQYTERSLKYHLDMEVRFLIQAYTENSFSKLEILYKDSEGRLCPRRYLEPSPLIFAAILYDFSHRQKTKLLQVGDILEMIGSPGRLFFLGREQLNVIIEQLHDLGYVRYERTHNLNQLRMKEEFSSMAFLKAYYHKTEPNEQQTEMQI